MTRPVFLITIGAVAGALAAVLEGGGGLGREIATRAWDAASDYTRIAAPATNPSQKAVDVANVGAPSVFGACLSKSGDSIDGALRDLLEFHEHDATLTLVECLLGAEPQRFCTPSGRQQAADAMEIYLWSRDDARRTSPAHGLAAKIHLLDRATQSAELAEAVDPFVLTWSGPRDRAIFDKLRELAKAGYLEPSAFAFSGRAELREALRDVKPEASPCLGLARGD